MYGALYCDKQCLCVSNLLSSPFRAVQRRRSGYDTLKQALCSVFDLDDSDLRIILAQAELLQPGFYSYAMT